MHTLIDQDTGERYKLHSSVIAMAKAMQEKIDKNNHKDNWPNQDGIRGWLQPVCTHQFILNKLREECEELHLAVMLHKAEDAPLDDIRLEAADVANIAMMVADNLGAYTTQEK